MQGLLISGFVRWHFSAHMTKPTTPPIPRALQQDAGSSVCNRGFGSAIEDECAMSLDRVVMRRSEAEMRVKEWKRVADECM